MEQASKTAQKTVNELTQTSSKLQPSNLDETTATIPRDVAQALFGLINRVRKQNGWSMKEFDELKPQIATWYTDFARHGIPVTAYTELFNRAFDYRVNKLSRGEDPMPMDSPLLVSQWIGENGLKKELEQRQVALGRTLGENAASVCKYCLGTGWRAVSEERNAAHERCDHQAPQARMDF
jgi:hypothetical protein